MRGGDVEKEKEGGKGIQPHFVGVLSQDGRKRKSVDMLMSTKCSSSS